MAVAIDNHVELCQYLHRQDRILDHILPVPAEALARTEQRKKPNRCSNAFKETWQVELLVRRVHLVIGKSKTKENRRNAKKLTEHADRMYSAARTKKNR
jgi:hypothetical protein